MRVKKTTRCFYNMKKLKIVYVCSGNAGLDCLYHLLNQYGVVPENVLVLTYDTDDNITLLKHLNALRIEYILKSINEKIVISRLSDFKPDFLFSIYYRDIIGKEALSLIKEGAVNLHSSLLPYYRGGFPVPWVLINGEKETGITYHMIDAGIDTGGIVFQRSFEIMPWDTAFSLNHRLASLGVYSFPVVFENVVGLGLGGVKQNRIGRLYLNKLPHDGLISLDWEREKIERFIRAMYFPPFDGAKLRYKNQEYQFSTMGEFENFCDKKGIDCE